MASIGFTTGALYKLNIPMDEKIKLLHSLGMEAIELSFATPRELLGYKPSVETQNLMKTFRYVSIHAPWKNVGYSTGQKTGKILQKLEYLCQKVRAKGIVLHPDIVLDFQRLARLKLPFLVENLDKKKYSNDPRQFEALKEKYEFGFVLDIQHAYNQDPSMELAEKLFQVMGDKLRQLHVSGGTTSGAHLPVHLSENKANLEEFLSEHNKVHWILEGAVEKDILATLKNELEFVKKLK